MIALRSVHLISILAIASALTVGGPASAQESDAEIATGNESQKCHHALSLVGEPKEPEGFKHFDWVNPDAPKGGTLRQFAQGTFDTLNPFEDKGVKAAGLGLVFDSLMGASTDEPATAYGLIAKCVRFPDDYSSAKFELRPEARFHDGEPIKPEDVVFTLKKLKEINPFYAYYYKNVVKVEKTGEHEVTFSFDRTGNRELPFIVGEISVLPKHYWEGEDARGKQRDIDSTTVEPPLGSGAYKIANLETGRNISYVRVKDYWAKDLPVMRGQFNFDEIKYTYYRDRTPAFEDFKSGKLDLWVENQAASWATKYNFDALKNGLVKKEAIPIERVAAMQCFAFNTRRTKFSDPRVRRAFNLLFNFEQVNQKLFYNLYVRLKSFFDNSELASRGLPEGLELEFLNEVKDQVPDEVFTTEWQNPTNNQAGDFRNHQREAMKLFNAAGWKLGQDRIMRNARGQAMVVEFLLDSDTFERIVLPFAKELERFGIKATVRVVDSAQYKQREDKRDFDIIVDSFPQSLSPGNEQRDFWGSEAADKPASRNTIGIKNPAVDKMIDKIVFAKNRDELVAATRALDRILLWNHYVVPQWHYPYERLAYWDVFGQPDKLPSQSSAPLQIWWYDADKAKTTNAKRP